MSESDSQLGQLGFTSRCAAKWMTAAITFAAIGTCGSVFLSIGLGLKACPLCFYQRSFVMAVLVVLGLGRFLEPSRPGLFSLLAVPLTWAGLGVAAFHEYLVLTEVLECPPALFGIGTAPAQSLAVFIAMTIAITAGAWCGRHESPRQRACTLFLAVMLGAVLEGACVKSSPPLPPVPTAAYDPVKQPLDTCRRPFDAAKN